MKIKQVTKLILPLLATTVILTGCAARSDCEIKKTHAHKYYCNTNIGTIYTYMNSEYLKDGEFYWTKDYIDLTLHDDVDFFEIKKDLFDGRKNWGYLYNGMKDSPDYLSFYYSYDEDEDYWDGDGNHQTRKKNYSGWTTNPRARGVTGEVALNHYRFFSYKIVKNDGKYERIQSPLVDDIREVLDEYPYAPKRFAKSVYVTYRFKVRDLPNLKVSDFDYFTGPDLENTSPDKRVK